MDITPSQQKEFFDIKREIFERVDNSHISIEG